tara:strand:- start:7749 stop:8357 length:609 start_codon:yes stop_codon:yes gene_type:complete
MEYGQQMQQAKDNAMMAFYQNPGYQLERREKKTFILKVDSNGTINFNEPLQEPLIIDRLSDIYLESFLTFHYRIDGVPRNESGNPTWPTIDFKDDINKSAFVLKINEFNNQGNSSEGNTFNKIVIPHVIPTSGQTGPYRKIHKSRKLNYICSMNPTTLSSLSGTITGLDGTTNMFTKTGNGGVGFPYESDMFLAEFVIVARD